MRVSKLSLALNVVMLISLASSSLLAQTHTRAFPVTPESAAQEKKWVPVTPVPRGSRPPNLWAKQLRYPLQWGYREVARYCYRDQAGALIGYAVRLENKEGEKTVLPLTYCRSPENKYQWRWRDLGDQRPIYGLEKLSRNPAKTILIVEGEKTTLAAQKLLPQYLVLSWRGGAQEVEKVNWSVLSGRSIIIWPDNDEAGFNSSEEICKLLEELPRSQQPKEVRLVTPPSDLPLKWDLADPLPPGWSRKRISATLRAAPIVGGSSHKKY